jgi:uncharacterized protein YbaA (DUF1428 family)
VLEPAIANRRASGPPLSNPLRRVRPGHGRDIGPAIATETSIMSSYIDGYILPIRKDQVEAYRRIANMAAGLWREHGALSYRECVAEDLAAEGMTPFPVLVNAKADETIVFAWIEFASRADRDRINAAVMNDPRMTGMGPDDVPFDCRRMAYGGFETLVQR